MLLLDEPLSGVDPASATLIEGVFGELRESGRTLLVASHDVESARSYDLVLCLNRRQVAFGHPAATLDRETLQATYGHELIVLEGGRAVTVQHHEHGHSHEVEGSLIAWRSIDFLVDPLRSGIDRRALLELAMVGSLCGALGFWIVTERLAYGAESLSHGLLPGLVLAALAGAPLLLGAAGGALVAAALIAFASRDPRVGADTGTAIAVTGLVGLGALLALAPDAPQRLEELLFGDPLGVTDGDLVAAALLLVLGGAVLAALHRPLSAVAFDPAGAATAGVRPGLARLALLVLLAAAVAVAVQGLGALLVLAVLIGPPVAVRARATPRPRHDGGAAVAVRRPSSASRSPSTPTAPPAPRWRSPCAPPPRSAARSGRRRARHVGGARPRSRRRAPSAPAR